MGGVGSPRPSGYGWEHDVVEVVQGHVEAAWRQYRAGK